MRIADCMLLLATGLAAAAGCAAPEPLTGQAAQFADFRDATDLPAYRAILVQTAPVVDGEMDAAYSAAEPIRFVFINGDPRRPKLPTTARMLCTKEALYVLYRCQYRGREGVKWVQKDRDAQVWLDNCVEVFLEPTGTGSSRYYQVVVNPGGQVAELLERRLEAWNPQIQVATKIRPAEWTAELAIPFNQLDLEPPKLNKLWRMNLTRFSLSPAEDTSWCVLGDYSSHVPSRFGYLWLDAGSILNVSAQQLQPWRPLFNGRDLAGWRIVRGSVAVRDGAMVVRRDSSALVALRAPLCFEDFVVSAEVISDKQLRFIFARDANNEKMGFYATFINFINESNFALVRDWQYWVPPMGFHLTIPHYGPCPMADDTWYRCEVHFRPERVSMLLNGRVLLEGPNFYPNARWLGLDIIGGGKIKNLRIRRLLTPDWPIRDTGASMR